MAYVMTWVKITRNKNLHGMIFRVSYFDYDNYFSLAITKMVVLSWSGMNKKKAETKRKAD